MSQPMAIEQLAGAAIEVADRVGISLEKDIPVKDFWKWFEAFMTKMAQEMGKKVTPFENNGPLGKED